MSNAVTRKLLVVTSGPPFPRKMKWSIRMKPIRWHLNFLPEQIWSDCQNARRTLQFPQGARLLAAASDPQTSCPQQCLQPAAPRLLGPLRLRPKSGPGGALQVSELVWGCGGARGGGGWKMRTMCRGWGDAVGLVVWDEAVDCVWQGNEGHEFHVNEIRTPHGRAPYVPKGRSLRRWDRRGPPRRPQIQRPQRGCGGKLCTYTHPVPEPLPWSVMERMPRMSVTEWEEGQVRGMATEPGMAGTPGGVGTLAAAAVMGLGYE